MPRMYDRSDRVRLNILHQLANMEIILGITVHTQSHDKSSSEEVPKYSTPLVVPQLGSLGIITNVFLSEA